MTKRTNFIVDTILIGLLLASGASGIILWAGALPKGTAIRVFFKFMHKWGGLGLALLATYHLILHWDWYVRAWHTALRPSPPQAVEPRPNVCPTPS